MNTSIPAAVLIAPIRGYQRFISRYTPPSCRYYPCCSSYAITALRTRGALVGTALTGWRLLRCNPWTAGGVDHVPLTGWPRRERHAPPGSSTTGGATDGAAVAPRSGGDRVEPQLDAGGTGGTGGTRREPACPLDARPPVAGDPTIGRSAA
ncbi:MAG TPA: membrane protein insertion efficiency factor YidD [Nakamurella sp.]|nr:membrane protein insertion efficiency factor YidD [Nakamurella sp.]